MAIDTRAKRQSALLFGEEHQGVIDGSIGQGDRQDVLGAYRGILAAVLAELIPLFRFLGSKYVFTAVDKYVFRHKGTRYKFTHSTEG